jgi:hypothetical protein
MATKANSLAEDMSYVIANNNFDSINESVVKAVKDVIHEKDYVLERKALS